MPLRNIVTGGTAGSMVVERNHNAIYDDVTDNLANIMDYPLKETDTPVFWHIPKCGGTSIKNYFGCIGLVEASEKGALGHSDNEPELRVHEQLGNFYVNVDIMNRDGANRAKELSLAESGLADVVITVFPFAAEILFTAEYRGRVFALLRHPVERAVSLFYYKQIASWEKNPNVYRPDLEGFDVETWLERGQFKDDVNGMYGNYVVSKLVGKGPRNDDLTNDDLELAKQILDKTIVVGLTSRMEESVKRFDRYFGWTNRTKEHPDCLELFIRQGINKNDYQHVEEGSITWTTFTEMAKYDMQLYEYAIQLFDKQGEKLFVTETSEEVGK